MRVTETGTYLSFLNDLQHTKEQMANAELQVTSGKKVNKPSDDPAAASDIVRISGEKAVDDQFSRNIDAAKSRLTAADNALNGVQTMLDRIVQLGLAATTTGSDTKSSIPEIQGLRDQMISVANTTVQGRYIFGGSLTTTPAYVKQNDSSVTYAGDSNAVVLQVARDNAMQVQVPGSDVFSGNIDVFDTMSQMINAMQAGDNNAVAAQVNKLQQLSDTVSTARSRVGGYMNVADDLSSQLTTRNIARTSELNNVQTADTAQSLTQLTLTQTNLQATLAVGARIAQMNLLDYIR